MNTINTLLPKENCKKIKELDSKKIITNYFNNYNYAASRHFNNLNTVSIYECEKTGFRFYSPVSTEGDNQFYVDLYTNNKGLYFEDKWEFSKALESITAEMRVLDIGCGNGSFLLKARNEKKANVFALEKSTYAVSILKERKIPVFDFELHEFAEVTKERFDVVCAFQVLEHVSEPGQFIKDAAKLLNPNGILIIGVPNSDPYLYKKDMYHTLNLPPHHMGLWNKEALQKLAPYFDLKVNNVFYEPLDNVFYYLLCQLGFQNIYWQSQKNSIMKFLSKCFRHALIPFNGFFKGRALLAFYSPKIYE
jgi:2-polyprenyl-3-methyl-5-hydroxy-6-metoxy-1,4-benzoquinol methylase